MDAAKVQERGSSGAQSSEPDSGACENTEVRECAGATGAMDSGEGEDEEAAEDDDDLVAILSGLASSKPSKAARMVRVWRGVAEARDGG